MITEFAVDKKRASDTQTLFRFRDLRIDCRICYQSLAINLFFFSGTLTSKIFAKRLKESVTPHIMHRRAQNSVVFLGEPRSEGEIVFCTILSFTKESWFSQYPFNNKQLIWFKIKLVHTQSTRLVRGAITA